MELIKVNQDTVTLVDELFDGFKNHLRILHDIEDDSIRGYLGAAIDAIGTYAGTEIFQTDFAVLYTADESDYRVPSTLFGWYTGRWNISNVTITGLGGNDVTGDYTVDGEKGMIYSHPRGNNISFSTGYATKDDIPYNLRNIIFRLAADFYENREAVRIGEPKTLPMWVEYSMASIWQPRV